jgi:hypothetical protein
LKIWTIKANIVQAAEVDNQSTMTQKNTQHRQQITYSKANNRQKTKLNIIVSIFSKNFKKLLKHILFEIYIKIEFFQPF